MIPAIGDIVAAAIEQTIFPGAVVHVQRAGEVLHAAAYGRHTYGPAARPVSHESIYDLASISKIFTATVALRLYDAGHLRLDDPVARFLPGFRAPSITIRHLLTHSSGLDLRLSALRDQGANGIRAALYAALPRYQPGTVMAYTNSNSLLLGDVIAAITAQSLDRAMQELLLEPLGLRETDYCPPPERWPRIPPGEYDDHWRGGLVWGQVHDESAYALGGVAGHAGLFGSAADIERFARSWLNGGEDLLQPATVALALRDHSVAMRSGDSGPALRGGLGWMLDRPFMGSAPPGSAGHTGFTGPVLIIIPARQISIVILSNRTYPYRRPPPYPHHRVTARIVDAVLACCR